MSETHPDTLAHVRRDLTVTPSTNESKSIATASTHARIASMCQETESRSKPTKGGIQCWRRSVRLPTTRSCS